MTRQRYAQRNRRRGHFGQGAQAVLEMAMVTPIMLALVFNFLAVMIEVKDQNELQTATSLAAQSALAAPVHESATSCAYASAAFWSTVYGRVAGAGPCPGGSPDPFSSMQGSPAGAAMIVQAPGVTCRSANTPPLNPTGNSYLTGAGYPLAAGTTTGPVVSCTATAKFNFSGSPLGVFVLWTPTFTATSQAVPTTVRQCSTAVVVC